MGGANEHAAMSVAREIRSVLTASGVPGHSIEVRPYPTRDPARLGAIRVNYPKMVAETGQCGLWPEDIGPTVNEAYVNNRPHWNHGCATQRNFAAQECERLPQILHAVDVDLIDHRRFERICFGDEQPAFAAASRLERNRQHTLHRPN